MKYVIVLGILIVAISCKSQKTELEIEDAFVKKYGNIEGNINNDLDFVEYEHIVYYKNELYEKIIQSIESLNKDGNKFEKSERLQKVYGLAKGKLDSIQSLKK